MTLELKVTLKLFVERLTYYYYLLLLLSLLFIIIFVMINSTPFVDNLEKPTCGQRLSWMPWKNLPLIIIT